MQHKRFIEMSLAAARRIDNGRTTNTIYDHLKSEAVELDEEMVKYNANEPQGDDGIVGESVDVMLCALDLIYSVNPSVSSDYIIAILERKIAKWEKLYSKSPFKEPPLPEAEKPV
jgi:hypothetical protein